MELFRESSCVQKGILIFSFGTLLFALAIGVFEFFELVQFSAGSEPTTAKVVRFIKAEELGRRNHLAKRLFGRGYFYDVRADGTLYELETAYWLDVGDEIVLSVGNDGRVDRGRNLFVILLFSTSMTGGLMRVAIFFFGSVTSCVLVAVAVNKLRGETAVSEP